MINQNNTNALEDIFDRMIWIRAVEMVVAKNYSSQQMRCPIHLSVGQELAGATVGVLVNLGHDKVFSAHRSHAHLLGLKGNLDKFFAELLGFSQGCAGGRGGSMHLIDFNVGLTAAVPIVGSSIPIGVGSALASKLSNDGAVSIVFLGDGATEEGVFAESLDFAALHSLPVIFVVEQNFYSVYTSLSTRQEANRNICEISRSHGVNATYTGANDAIRLHGALQEAFVKARSKCGPTLIVTDTYRSLEHCGPSSDDNLGYRPIEELEKWQKMCPIKMLGEILMRSDWIHLLESYKEIAQFKYDAILEKGNMPSPDELENNLYFGVTQ